MLSVGLLLSAGLCLCLCLCLCLSLCLSLCLCLCQCQCQLLSVELAPRVARLAGRLLQHRRVAVCSNGGICGGCHTRAVMYGLWPLLPPGLALGQVNAG